MSQTLEQIRVSRQITQKELAARAGVSHPVVWRAESGRPIRPWAFEALCRALCVSSTEIVGVRIYRRLGTLKRK
jgi:transcriptional regulator with XRE-family HTH domain